jgi:hypothetical protein
LGNFFLNIKKEYFRYLDMASEGTILLTERLPTSTEFNFKLLEEGSSVAIVHKVLDNEFKVYF